MLNPLWDARVEAMTGVTCIDLSQVSRVDTGGLALLVHLISLAKKQGNNVSLAGVDDKVFTLAELYNLLPLTCSRVSNISTLLSTASPDLPARLFAYL